MEPGNQTQFADTWKIADDQFTEIIQLATRQVVVNAHAPREDISGDMTTGHKSNGDQGDDESNSAELDR